MLKITLGEMLKRFRIEKGIEARQVCSGLCSNAMISCFEKGTKVPDTLLFEYMMERMGVSPELFSVMVSKEEYEYYGWKEQVCNAINARDFAKLEELLAAKITEVTYCNTKLEQQFLLYARAIWCGMNKLYSEAFEMLEKAAKQTIPNKDVIGNSKMLLSAMELHILMLYLYYGVLGGVLDVHRGKALFHDLEKYVDSENLELILRAKIYPKLCCVGILLFEQTMTENKQLELCKKSVEFMVQDMSFHEITNVLRLYIPLLEKYDSCKVNFYKKQYAVFEDILKTQNVETEFYAESLITTSPKIYIINEYLLSKRRTKDMTQEELSEGICEPETYSRVETGKRAPSKKNLRSLAERLDINWCYFRGELDTTNLKAFELRTLQRLENIKGHDKESLVILSMMEECLDMLNVTNIQYIRTNEYIAERHLEMLSTEETYIKLMELLGMTCNDKIDTLGLNYYSQNELEIVARAAQMLRDLERVQEGINLITKIINQMKNSQVSIKAQWNGFSFLIHVLSGLFFKGREYEKSLECIKYILEENIRRRQGDGLPEVLDSLADCLEHMGEQYSEEYRKLYRYTYYVADFFRIEKIIGNAKAYYENNFEKEIVWY